MRYILPLILLAGLAGCAYDNGYAYQAQYQPAYVQTYDGGYYARQYHPTSTVYGSCETTPFVWGTCPESPSD